MSYTKSDFFKDRDSLLESKSIPSENFCNKFLSRIPDENINPFANDKTDYHAWGYALYDDIEINGESTVGALNLWHWIEFWDALKLFKKGYDNSDVHLKQKIMDLGAIIEY